MKTVTFSVIALDNCISSGVTGIIDTLNLANIIWMTSTDNMNTPLFKMEIVTIDGNKILANGGISLIPETSIREVKNPDVIILPAFLPPFNVKNKSYRPLIDWLKISYKNGATIAATCTGAFLLAETGLLNGRSVTTNWLFAKKFQREYPEIELKINKIVNEDERLISTGAATAFLNLCLNLIEKFGTPELASFCSKAMLIDPDKLNQSPYMTHNFWKDHLDTQILTAQDWMEKNFSKKISIDDIAENVGISSRHFKRRFKKATDETPLSYLQHLRIEKAKQLLEHSSETINEITWQVGYEDINSFRRLFKKSTEMSPKAFRNKFSKKTKSV